MPKKTLFICLILFLLISSGFLLAWDSQVIHPRLTQKAIEVYNQEKEQKITKKQADWIIQGAIEEDVCPRYKNHFYNPVTGKGLDDVDDLLGSGARVRLTGMSAKEWAFEQDHVSGDYSVGAILDYYREGKTKKAYIGMGHIVHLVEDMAVPAHVRNDAHSNDDPFEKWAKNNGAVTEGYSLVSISGIESAFDELAMYTHKNFFSKDTISIEDLSLNASIKKEKNLAGKLKNYIYDNNYKIILVESRISGKIYLFDSRIYIDYWNQLHPKAIGYSAGVIDWFVQEFKVSPLSRQSYGV